MRVGRTAVLAIVVGSIAGVAIGSQAGAARRKPMVEFRPVLSQLAPEASTPSTTARVDLVAANSAVASCDVAAVAQLPVVPTTKVRAAAADECVVFPDTPGSRRSARYFLGPAGNLPVDAAKAEFVAGQGWTVKLDFTEAGAKAWDRLAKEQFQRQVAITYEGLVVSAPTIQPNEAAFSSFEGTAVISGTFTRKEAVALAAAARLANGR
jgi:preprotein translocase subunit SecD